MISDVGTVMGGGSVFAVGGKLVYCLMAQNLRPFYRVV